MRPEQIGVLSSHSMEAAVANPPLRTPTDAVARAVIWQILIGASAGAIAGFIVGGIGGRLAMLLLRLTSPSSVIGMISDDGFEIGMVTFHTLNLVLAMTMLGSSVGVLYAAIRGAIPARLRFLLWSLLCALFGGSAFVHDDGVDFSLLKPALLAIVLFVALPGAAGAAMVLLTERWSNTTPWQSRRLAAGLLVTATAGTVAVLFGIVAGAIVLAISIALEHAGRAGNLVQRAGRVVVPLVVAMLTVMAAIDLVRKSTRILD